MTGFRNFWEQRIPIGKKATRRCACGFLGDSSGRCRCTPDQVQRYRSRISGPLLDRIDMQIEVPHVPHTHILGIDRNAESSEVVRQRVIAAREKQIARANKANAYLTNREVETFCTLTTADQQLLCKAIEHLGLSARSTHRILKVARTIADLANSTTIVTSHLSEAMSYRQLDRTTRA